MRTRSAALHRIEWLVVLAIGSAMLPTLHGDEKLRSPDGKTDVVVKSDVIVGDGKTLKTLQLEGDRTHLERLVTAIVEAIDRGLARQEKKD